jgi:hypothetical protein
MAFSLSALAGMIERGIVYPLDVAKTRLQLQTEPSCGVSFLVVPNIAKLISTVTL